MGVTDVGLTAYAFMKIEFIFDLKMLICRCDAPDRKHRVQTALRNRDINHFQIGIYEDLRHLTTWIKHSASTGKKTWATNSPLRRPNIREERSHQRAMEDATVRLPARRTRAITTE